MGTAWRKSTRVPALRVPVLLMGLGQAARALRQPSEASTPSESIAPDSASARAPPGSTSREARRGVANLTGECPRRARARQLHRGPRTRPPLARPGHAGCTVGGCVGPRWYLSQKYQWRPVRRRSHFNRPQTAKRRRRSPRCSTLTLRAEKSRLGARSPRHSCRQSRRGTQLRWKADQ